MNIKEMSSKKAIEASNRFIEDIKSGSIKKRIMPNSGRSFDDGKALERFKKSCQNPDLKELAKKIYE